MLTEKSKKFLRALNDPEWDAYLDYLERWESGEAPYYQSFDQYVKYELNWQDDEPNIGRKIEEPYRGKLEEAE